MEYSVEIGPITDINLPHSHAVGEALDDPERS
jgi:hypothetical protein